MSEITSQAKNLSTTAQNATQSATTSHTTPSSSEKPNPPSEAEIQAESAKAAQQSLALQDKARNLKQAAQGARDADERQKLLEQALDAEIAAESFGKTAKYLRSGTFQGMCVGGGMGTIPGLTLGTLTGTLVGGVVSLVTGGLGAGIGALVGAVHGPFWNMGEIVGRGIRKVTGDLPWSAKATDEQKRKLEEMIGQASKEDMPHQGELMGYMKDAGAEAWGTSGEYVKGWGDYVWSWVPGWSGWGNKTEGEGDKVKAKDTKANETKEGTAKRKQIIEQYHEGRTDQRSVDALAARSKAAAE